MRWERIKICDGIYGKALAIWVKRTMERQGREWRQGMERQGMERQGMERQGMERQGREWRQGMETGSGETRQGVERQGREWRDREW